MINEFNDEQKMAIDQRDASILVSAPAGSGKTKILVSRIMSLIIDDLYEIDQFLVVTFTQAAAGEMKQRLLVAIEAELNKNLDPMMENHLLTQKKKLPYAYITNFHGFCSQLLKKYGYIIEVQQGFEILSNPILIKNEVLDNCIEHWLEDSKIKTFIETYFNEMRFDNFKTFILDLYDLLHSMESVDKFTDFVVADIYNNYINKGDSVSDWLCFDEVVRQLELKLKQCYDAFIELQYYADDNNIDSFFNRPDEQSEKQKAANEPATSYNEFFTDKFNALKNYQTAPDQFVSVIQSKLGKSYNMVWDKELPDIDIIKKKFNSKKLPVVSIIKKANELLDLGHDGFVKNLSLTVDIIDLILGKDGLFYQFKESYQQKKRELNYLDFNDLEQSTIKLLQKDYPVSKLLYNQLKEIMIDEYQDTNMVQENLISMIKDFETPCINSFLVGDMKQAIYRFRQADPDLFIEKFNSYSTNVEDVKATRKRRIDLQFNYRSNKIVLDSVNYIFNQIMDESIGGLKYFEDPSSHLNYDFLRKERCQTEADYNDKKSKAVNRFASETRFDTEVLLIDKDTIDELKPIEYEAHQVALRILDLVQNSTVDNFDGKKRNIVYKDIVVLMRGTAPFLTFKKVFDLYQIPNHIVLSQGYLNSNEVVSTLSALKAIINPFDDISLLALLRGNYLFSNFSEDLIIDVRSIDKKASIFNNLAKYVEIGKDTGEVSAFLDYFNNLREKLYQMSAGEYLEQFLNDSGNLLFVSKLINGTQRRANLEMLIEDFKNVDSQQDIFEIVGEYEKLLQYESKASPAQVISSSDDVVQFMTIHKSKGLEFPIVFVSNINKQFNKQDAAKKIIINKKLGLAINPTIKMDMSFDDGVILNQLVEYQNPYKRLLAAKEIEDSINEELRILYVALTRASQKLILTGVASVESIENWIEMVNVQNRYQDYNTLNISQGDVIFYDKARAVNNYLDWIGLAIMRHPQVLNKLSTFNNPEIAKSVEKIIAQGPYNKLFLPNTEAAKFDFDLIDCEQLKEKMILQHTTTQTTTDTQIIINNLPEPSTITKTISVTKLQEESNTTKKHHTNNDDNKVMNAAEKGTLVHAFFEYLPMDGTAIDDVLESLYQKGLYDEEKRNVIIEYKDKIESFIESDCYHIMLEAKHLFKEKKFSLFDETTKQIVRGIFDVLCIYDDKVIVIDYKTDRVSLDTDEYWLKENHRVQMEYYKKILSKIYPEHHIEAKVFYLEIGKYITI